MKTENSFTFDGADVFAGKIIAFLCLFTYFMASVCTVVKLKLNIGLADGVNVVASTMWFIINVVFSFSNNFSGIQWHYTVYILLHICGFLIKANLVFYGFEMLEVKKLLKSDSLA